MSSQDFVRRLPRTGQFEASLPLYRLHLDPTLLLLLTLTLGYGLVVLYSAINRDPIVFRSQLIRIGLGFVAMLIAAQINLRFYRRWTPVLYGAGVTLLVLVLLIGVEVKGSQRWLNLPGLPRFQPSELLKLAVPMMVAWYLHDRTLPPTAKDLAVCMGIIVLPAVCIVLQPDLGTGILVAMAGFAVVLLAGLTWRWILSAVVAVAALTPVLWWYVLQDYQKKRVLTLLDPQSDPLGAGWNIIQSTTAIGSGGLYGKGLFQGTQSHLDFLPESQTDFIIAVIGEEFGFLGVSGLLALYLMIVARGLFIATQASRTYDRLVCGALTLTFFVYVFVNIGMVIGLLPVVGVPLPLVSYGGTSAITLMAGFGIIMAIRTQRAW